MFHRGHHDPAQSEWTATIKTPFTEPEYKIPGFTGHIHGLVETFKKTPIPAQIETKQPDDNSFIHTRTEVQYVTTRASTMRDPCNDSSNFKKPTPDNVWPMLQETSIRESFKPPVSNIAFGDSRIDPFKTSYNRDYTAPFAHHARLRSPNRNKDLAKTTASLVDIYRSSFNRVTGKRLQKMIATMRERMDAKCGNSNDNAFRIRKLFLAWDKDNTGMVHYEDLRQMCEAFGMQLDDDSLMALFYVYDPEGTGYLAYMDLVKHLMHPDTFCYYVGKVDNSQLAADASLVKTLVKSVQTKFTPVVRELEVVLKSYDSDGTGFLSVHDVLCGCAALGVIVSESEFQSLLPLLNVNAAGQVDYAHLCSIFSS